MKARKFKCIDTTWIKGIELGMIYSLSQIEDILDQIDERFNIERFIETFQEITEAEEILKKVMIEFNHCIAEKGREVFLQRNEIYTENQRKYLKQLLGEDNE